MNLTIGHICECGKFHKWSAYVYAHYTEDIIHTCPNCGSMNMICNGRIIEGTGKIVKEDRRKNDQENN